jgi:hypothetical protein
MVRLTPTRRLLDHLLPGGLDAFVLSRRENHRSWRLIARDIYELTSVDITYEALRSWYSEPNGDEGAAA